MSESKPPTFEENVISLLRNIEHNSRMANNFLYKILEKVESLDKNTKDIKEKLK